MTKEQIVKKMIKKAVKGGYKGKIGNDYVVWCDRCNHLQLYVDDDGQCVEANIYEVIFSPDFAKAYWGEEEGYNKVDFIYCKQKGTKVFDSTLIFEDFLKHNSQKELNLLLDKKVHTFGNLDYLGEITYYRTKEGWQYHQHKMLGYLQEGKEPLKYIEKFLDKEVK